MENILLSFIKTIKEEKIILFLVLGLSLVVATINFILDKPTYIAKFEMAPYFEIASDLGNEFNDISNAINNEDSLFLNKKLNQNTDLSIFKSTSFRIVDKGADYSFKHKNLLLSVELSDTNATSLIRWDKALTKFCNSFVVDSIRSYRGIEVWRQKLIMFGKGKYFGINPKNPTFNFYKSDFLKQNINLNDSTINDIIYAQTLGEYKSAFTNNYYNSFNNSKKLKERTFSNKEVFLLILFIPFFITLVFLRSSKYE